LLKPLLALESEPLVTEALLLLVALRMPLPWLRVTLQIASLRLARISGAAALLTSPGKTFKGLLEEPAYMVRKLLLIPCTVRAAQCDAAWVRAERNVDVTLRI